MKNAYANAEKAQVKDEEKAAYYCPCCGSTSLLFEARSVWDFDKQDWDFFMDKGTDAWCDDCGEEIGQELEWGDPADWEKRDEELGEEA